MLRALVATTRVVENRDYLMFINHEEGFNLIH